MMWWFCGGMCAMLVMEFVLVLLVGMFCDDPTDLMCDECHCPVIGCDTGFARILTVKDGQTKRWIRCGHCLSQDYREVIQSRSRG